MQTTAVSLLLTFLSCFIRLSSTINGCSTNEDYRSVFYKVHRNSKSKQPILGRKRASTSAVCAEFARDRTAFAFNYAPIGSVRDYYNCQVVPCPESIDSDTLLTAEDEGYDFYSKYANLNVLINSTCVPLIGVFKFFAGAKENYTAAIISCQEAGGDLADVLAERRTNVLSQLLASQLADLWYKAAYVGLERTEETGAFVSATGTSIGCYKYRAWAPGHPRRANDAGNNGCVVLDDRRMWRTTDCWQKLPFICELYSQSFN